MKEVGYYNSKGTCEHAHRTAVLGACANIFGIGRA